MLLGTSHNTLMEAESLSFKFPTFLLIKKVWKVIKEVLEYQEITEFSPLWDNMEKRKKESALRYMETTEHICINHISEITYL